MIRIHLSRLLGERRWTQADLGVASCWVHRAKEEFESEAGKDILKELGIEGDYIESTAEANVYAFCR